jgi:hypothetical protein
MCVVPERSVPVEPRRVLASGVWERCSCLSRTLLAIGALAALLSGAACNKNPVGERATAGQVQPAQLAQLQLGVTTPAEIEARFGTPTQRTPDGALVYRVAGRRNHPPEQETVTFRFASGVLHRICRTRGAAR